MLTQTIEINLTQSKLSSIIMRSEEKGREIAFSVIDEAGDPVALEDYSVKFLMLKPDENVVYADVVSGVLTQTEQMTTSKGAGYYCIRIIDAGTVIYSGQGRVLIDDHVIDDETLDSISEVDGYIFPDDFATHAWVEEYVDEYTGSDVIANPDTAPTDTLETVTIEDTTYDIIHPAEDASGNPIEITDAAAAPMVKCVSAITGSQDLHGYDKPWVGGAGINLARPAEVKTYTNNGVTFESDGNGNIKITGTATGGDAICSFACDEYVIPNGSSHTVLFKNTQGSSEIQFSFINDNTVVDTWGLVDINRAYYGYQSMSNKTVDEYKLLIVLGTQVDCTISLMFVAGNVTNNQPSFTPYSNICPITAYTEGEIEVRGKNIFDKDNVNSITAYVTANSGLLEAGSTEHSIYLYLDQGTYTVQRIIPSSDTTTKRFRFRLFRNVPQIGETGDVLYDGSTELTATVTLPYSGYLLIFMFNGDSAWNARQEVFDSIQIEKGSTATPYEPYTSTTHTAQFGEDIYSGEADYVGGSVGCSMAVVDLEDFTWFNVVPDKLWATTRIPNIKYVDNNTKLGNCIAEKYENHAGAGMSTTVGCIAIDTTWVSCNFENPSGKFAYELATPTTSSVTPTNLPIKSLLGYNHIESSTGALDITYIKQPYEPIIRSAEQADTDLIRITAAYDAASLSNTDVSINYQDYDALVIYVNDVLTQCGVSSLYTREYLDYCRANNRTLTFFPFGTAYISYNILTDKLEYAGDNNQGFYIIRIDGINFRR